LPPDLVAAIEDRSDGNPLFIEELLRSWVAVGTLAFDADRWQLTRPPGAVALPSTVQAIYAGQLDDLPPAVRDVARRASVAGRRFPEDALGVLGADAPATGVAGLLARALVSGPIPDTLTGPGYAYRHALLRDAGYSSLARADRARLHVRLAVWLESIAGDGREEIADQIGGHYEAALAAAPALALEIDAGQDREAVATRASAWLERAADRAITLAATEAGAELLRRSLALTRPTDGIDAARRTLRLASSVASSGDMDDGERLAGDAESMYRRAFRASPDASSERAAARDGYARATDARARIVQEQIRFKEAEAIARAALADIEDTGDRPSAVLALRAATAAAYFSDDPVDIVPTAERVLDIARREGDSDLELEALDRLALWAGGEPETTLARVESLELLAEARGRWDVAGRALRVIGWTRSVLGRDPWAALDRADELAGAHGMREASVWVDYTRAEVGFALGDWDDAWLAGTRAVDLGEANAYHRATVRTWHVLVPMAAARGNTQLLRRAARWYHDHEGIFPDSPYGRLMRRAIDLILADAGIVQSATHDLASLLHSFDQELDNASTLEAVWVTIDAWVRAGDRVAAATAVEHVVRGVERPESSLFIRGAAAVMLGGVATSDGDPMALGHIRDGIAHLRAVGARWWLRRALRMLAAAGAASTGESEEAAAIEASLGVAHESRI
jgi:hypothetical protein